MTGYKTIYLTSIITYICCCFYTFIVRSCNFGPVRDIHCFTELCSFFSFISLFFVHPVIQKVIKIKNNNKNRPKKRGKIEKKKKKKSRGIDSKHSWWTLGGVSSAPRVVRSTHVVTFSSHEGQTEISSLASISEKNLPFVKSAT